MIEVNVRNLEGRHAAMLLSNMRDFVRLSSTLAANENRKKNFGLRARSPGMITVQMRVHHTQIRRPRLPAHGSTLRRSRYRLKYEDLGYIILTKSVHELSALAIIQPCKVK